MTVISNSIIYTLFFYFIRYKNNNVKGLDVDSFFISHIQVNQANKQRRRTYRAHGKINPYMSSPCHIDFVREGRGVAKNLPSTCTRYRDPTSMIDFHFLFQCFFPQNLIDYVKTPLFILNAAYDSWQVMQPLSLASLASPTGVWKLPIGVVNEVQFDISAAAIREVKDETGVIRFFFLLLLFLGDSENHKAFFGKSDLFFVCKMQPLSFDVQKQDSEIEAAKVIL
ncbi:unnamed protein product [Coffea canephora]|uniref:Uncharacterized protein n=1 Tax=Coffea canephora TaxID=49390 RepID=A0A068UVX3_COFCA|nr:unnamed protein product [Coffea canephora]